MRTVLATGLGSTAMLQSVLKPYVLRMFISSPSTSASTSTSRSGVAANVAKSEVATSTSMSSLPSQSSTSSSPPQVDSIQSLLEEWTSASGGAARDLDDHQDSDHDDHPRQHRKQRSVHALFRDTHVHFETMDLFARTVHTRLPLDALEKSTATMRPFTTWQTTATAAKTAASVATENDNDNHKDKDDASSTPSTLTNTPSTTTATRRRYFFVHTDLFQGPDEQLLVKLLHAKK